MIETWTVDAVAERFVDAARTARRLPRVAVQGYGEKYKVEWNYLNKGTHEEDQAEEFDAVIVRRMLETVIKLDEAIDAPQA